MRFLLTYSFNNALFWQFIYLFKYKIWYSLWRKERISYVKIRNKGDEVVFTYDTHDADYLNTTEGKYLPAPHCLKGSKGWELYPEVAPLLKDAKVFEKPGFGSKELGHYIEANNFDEIYLCGLVSDICVFSNAIIAKSSASPYAKIKVVRNATSSFDLEMQEKAFDVLKHLHIEII